MEWPTQFKKTTLHIILFSSSSVDVQGSVTIGYKTGSYLHQNREDIMLCYIHHFTIEINLLLNFLLLY